MTEKSVVAQTTERIIDMLRDAYIDTYGPEKWVSLSDQQKHDVIMILTKDTLKALDILTEEA